MAPLNAKLRFITEAGNYDRVAIKAAIKAKAEKTGDLADAHRNIWSEAKGELALYEMRVLTRSAGLQTVADRTAPKAPGTSSVRAA